MIQLRRVAEDATTETIGWEPVPGANGYRFTVGGEVSHTWDGSRSTVRVSKAADGVLVEALGVTDTGTWPVVEPPSSARLVAEAVYTNAADVTDVPLWRTHGEQAKADDRMTVVNDPLGQRGKVMRVEVRPGDSAVAGSNAGERADVMASASAVPMKEGTIFAASLPIMLPNEFQSNSSGWNVCIGAHDKDGGTQSPLQFEIRDSRDLRLRILGGTHPNGLGTWSWRDDLGPWPLTKNKWHDLVWGMVFSADPKKGRAVVLVDGVEVADQPCANLYQGSYNYHKQGWYRVAQSYPTVLFMGPTRFWTADTLDAAVAAARDGA